MSQSSRSIRWWLCTKRYNNKVSVKDATYSTMAWFYHNIRLIQPVFQSKVCFWTSEQTSKTQSEVETWKPTVISPVLSSFKCCIPTQHSWLQSVVPCMHDFNIINRGWMACRGLLLLSGFQKILELKIMILNAIFCCPRLYWETEGGTHVKRFFATCILMLLSSYWDVLILLDLGQWILSANRTFSIAVCNEVTVHMKNVFEWYF